MGHLPWRVVGALFVALFAALLPASLAYAAPDPSVIERQIEENWNKLEPTIEQYNNVHNQLRRNQAKAAELSKKIQPLQAQVDAAMSRVSELAARYYKGGGNTTTLRALLDNGSAESLPVQLSLLDQVARFQKDQVADVLAIKNQYDSEKKKLDDLVALQAAQDADLAAKRKTIEAENDRLQKLRIQAYGSSNVGGELRIGVCPAVYIGGKAGIAVNFACSQIGKPYVWAANGPSTYDCSGLTQAAWGKAGVSLTHFTGAQWREGVAVPASQARPGDLVFFFSDLHHMGMYVGNGLMVHAPHSGDRVRMAYVNRMPVAGYRRPA